MTAKKSLKQIILDLQEISTYTEHGYGYYLGGDPRKFHPDFECCSALEIAAHESACKAWNEADAEGKKLEPEKCESGWVHHNDSLIHIAKSNYGIGGYEYKSPEAEAAQVMLASLSEDEKNWIIKNDT